MDNGNPSPTRRRTPTRTDFALIPDGVWKDFLAPCIGPQQIALNRPVSKFMNDIVWEKLTISSKKTWVTSLRIRATTKEYHHQLHCFDESMRFVNFLLSHREGAFTASKPLIVHLEAGKHVIESTFMDRDAFMDRDESGEDEEEGDYLEKETLNLMHNNISFIGDDKDASKIIGCVTVKNKSGVSFEKLQIVEKGMLIVENSTVGLKDCVLGHSILERPNEGYAGGMFATKGSVVTAERCIFEKTVEGDDAVVLRGTGTVGTFTDCSFQHNTNCGMRLYDHAVANFHGNTNVSCNNTCGLEAWTGVMNVHGEISFCNNGYTGANEPGQLRQGRNFGADIPTTDANGVVHMTPNALAHPHYSDNDFRSQHLEREETNSGLVAPNINFFEDTTIIRVPNTFYVLDHVSCIYYQGPGSNVDMYGLAEFPFAPFVPFSEEPVQQENVAVAEGLNAEETGEQEDVEGH